MYGGELMRDYLTALVGNHALRLRLGDELARGALAHAYILEGPSGCGKHTLARLIVMSLACENRQNGQVALPCGTCASCRKIAAGNCPDVITVTREEDKATMGVDVIRAMRDDVSTLPNDLDLKVYVIEDAHTMTPAAQSALLLTLEEPPPFVLFLLLSERSEVLLETIRSRAPILRMQPISDGELREYLLSHPDKATARAARALESSAPEEFSALLRMSCGRIGRALELLEEKKRAPLLAKRRVASSLCELLASTARSAELQALLLSLPSARTETAASLQTVNEALRDLLALSVTENAPLLFFTDREAAAELAARFTTATLLSHIEATDAALSALARGGNVRLTLTHYLCRLTA